MIKRSAFACLALAYSINAYGKTFRCTTIWDRSQPPREFVIPTVNGFGEGSDAFKDYAVWAQVREGGRDILVSVENVVTKQRANALASTEYVNGALPPLAATANLETNGTVLLATTCKSTSE